MVGMTTRPRTAPRSSRGSSLTSLRLPEAWLRALLAGVEAAVLGWLLVVVPTLAAYIATAAAPVLGEMTWLDAVRTSTGLWLVAHGGRLGIGSDAAISLVPLGLTLIVLLLVYGGGRRARLRSFGAGAFTVGGYAATVLAISAVVEGPAGRWTVLLGALVVGWLGVLGALRRRQVPAPRPWTTLIGRLWPEILGAIRIGAWSAVWLVGAGLVLTVVALIVGFPHVLELHTALAPGRLGTVALVLLQLMYAPTLVIWSTAYLLGPGFAAGSGMTVTAAEVTIAPLPAIPVFGALPVQPFPGHAWLPLLTLMVGAGAGWWLHRRHPAPSWWRALLAAAVVAVTGALVLAVLAEVSAGGIGVGRMADFGPEPWPVATTVVLLLAAGVLLVVVPAHPQVRAATGRWWRAGRAEVSDWTRRQREDAASRHQDGTDVGEAKDSADHR